MRVNCVLAWRVEAFGKGAKIKRIYFARISPRGGNKNLIAALCVNSVCLASFNHSALYVFSLGNMEERGERLIMSQQPIRSAAVLGTGSANDRHAAETTHYFFKNILLGAEIVTPGLIIFGLSRPAEKTSISDLQALYINCLIKHP